MWVIVWLLSQLWRRTRLTDTAIYYSLIINYIIIFFSLLSPNYCCRVLFNSLSSFFLLIKKKKKEICCNRWLFCLTMLLGHLFPQSDGRRQIYHISLSESETHSVGFCLTQPYRLLPHSFTALERNLVMAVSGVGCKAAVVLHCSSLRNGTQA